MLPNIVKDSGSLKMSVLETDSRFVQNSNSGTLLVITGRIRNEYASTRRFIEVTGKLFTTKNFTKSQTVYCGNLISDQDLANLSVETIQKRLSIHIGENSYNQKVEPQKTIPFMIVFSQLPDDLASLERYSVEVTGSYKNR
jgi:hypothetical protein